MVAFFKELVQVNDFLLPPQGKINKANRKIVAGERGGRGRAVCGVDIFSFFD